MAAIANSLGFLGFLTGFGASRAGAADPADLPEDLIRTQRDFILDRLDCCPDAFASEYDLHASMHVYPSRF